MRLIMDYLKQKSIKSEFGFVGFRSKILRIILSESPDFLIFSF